MSLRLDHLVVAARSLDEGVAWCRDALGVEPGPGGRHATMGTHNRLLSIASDAFPMAYFELIAVDPDAPAPGRTRWFDLDALDLSQGPRLAAFVARTDALDATLARWRAAGVDAGPALALSRDTAAGPLHWRIAVRDDGARPCSGAWPLPIEWRGRHPAASMPASGVTLQSLTLRGPPAAAALDLAHARVVPGSRPAVEARLLTPRGPVTLSSAR